MIFCMDGLDQPKPTGQEGRGSVTAHATKHGEISLSAGVALAFLHQEVSWIQLFPLHTLPTGLWGATSKMKSPTRLLWSAGMPRAENSDQTLHYGTPAAVISVQVRGELS